MYRIAPAVEGCTRKYSPWRRPQGRRHCTPWIRLAGQPGRFMFRRTPGGQPLARQCCATANTHGVAAPDWRHWLQ
ncbi:hypothetical protein, partial [Candidatus Synechococcus spongiarum]|uniref:hypothetical protein n=1 Tax=Candidatus Synechococcus spongiarum TaxID=431041 RepID=UPI00126819C5